MINEQDELADGYERLTVWHPIRESASFPFRIIQDTNNRSRWWPEHKAPDECFKPKGEKGDRWFASREYIWHWDGTQMRGRAIAPGHADWFLSSATVEGLASYDRGKEITEQEADRLIKQAKGPEEGTVPEGYEYVGEFRPPREDEDFLCNKPVGAIGRASKDWSEFDDRARFILHQVAKEEKALPRWWKSERSYVWRIDNADGDGEMWDEAGKSKSTRFSVPGLERDVGYHEIPVAEGERLVQERIGPQVPIPDFEGQACEYAGEYRARQDSELYMAEGGSYVFKGVGPPFDDVTNFYILRLVPQPEAKVEPDRATLFVELRHTLDEATKILKMLDNK